MVKEGGPMRTSMTTKMENRTEVEAAERPSSSARRRRLRCRKTLGKGIVMALTERERKMNRVEEENAIHKRKSCEKGSN